MTTPRCIGRTGAAVTVLRPPRPRRAAIPTGRRSIAKILEMPAPLLALVVAVAAAHKQVLPARKLRDRRQVLRPRKPAAAATAHPQRPAAIRTSPPCIAAMRATAARVQIQVADRAALKARLRTTLTGRRCIRRTRAATRRMLPASIRSGLRFTIIKMRPPVEAVQ
jgi:hypothetical protein